MRIAILMFAVGLLIPEFLWGPGFTDSGRFNYVWTLGMAGPEVYPRWLYSSFEGFGSSTFFYYAPLFFWFSGKLHGAGLSVEWAVNLVALFVLAASGWTMSAWLRFNKASEWWALAYMAAPYHLADLYGRGALAEFASYVWPPLIALAIQMLPRRRGMLLLAGSLAGLIMTHLPMALLTGVFLIAPMVVVRALRSREPLWPFAGAALASGVLGFGLAAGFLVPALGLIGYNNSQIFTGPYYQPSQWSVVHHIQAGEWAILLHRPLLAAALAVLALSVRGRPFWTWLAVGCGLAALGAPIWYPPLNLVQFPWRLLATLDFVAITALALAARRSLVGLTLACVLMFPFIVIEVLRTQTDFQRATPQWRATIERTRPDGAEYAPAGAKLVVESPALSRVDVTPYAKATPIADPIVVKIPGRVVLKRFYFPIWRVTGPDGPVAVRPYGPGQLVSFEARAGLYRIEQTPHPLEIAGWLVTLVAGLLTAALTFWGRAGAKAASS